MDIRHIADLAALHLNDREAHAYERDMERILKMIRQLPDTEEIPTPVSRRKMLLREDEAIPSSITQEDMLQNAPKVIDGCVVVPKTVES